MFEAGQIRSAFAGTKRPDDGALFIGDAEGAESVFAGRQWTELGAEELDNHSATLRFFTPPAFAYFLPAYLLAALEKPHLGIADVVVDALCPPGNQPSRASYQRWWSLLDPSQRRAVVAFMRVFEHRNPIAIGQAASALEGWHAG